MTKRTVGTSHYDEALDIETDIDVECEVTPGEPEVRWQRNGDPGWPGCGPEVEVLSAKSDDGRDWTETLLADRAWLARVEERAVEALSEDDSPYDTREEAEGLR